MRAATPQAGDADERQSSLSSCASIDRGLGIGVTAALVIMAAIGASSAVAARPITLCNADETVVYSCSTGSRFMSICASKDLTKSAGYLQYRYGPGGKPELVYPDPPRHPAGLFTPGTLMFSGGGGAYLRFSKPPYVYTVFSAIGNWGAAKRKATAQGVAVEKDGAEVANIPC
ncbi:MAG: hypothetical protein ACHQAY_13730 [Hyphomicrobiales bacterium]